MVDTCQRCGARDALDGWCDACFRARVDRLVREIDHTQPDRLASVYVGGMRELGATDEQIF